MKNIHRVADPLCLWALEHELDEIAAVQNLKTRNARLMDFQKKLGELLFLDPACGSGNFYGIEIDGFAVSVAQTALWIAELQMMLETEQILHRKIDFLPFKRYAHIRATPCGWTGTGCCRAAGSSNPPYQARKVGRPRRGRRNCARPTRRMTRR